MNPPRPEEHKQQEWQIDRPQRLQNNGAGDGNHESQSNMTQRTIADEQNPDEINHRQHNLPGNEVSSIINILRQQN